MHEYLQKKVLLALEDAGVFTSGGMVKDKVTTSHSSTANGNRNPFRILSWTSCYYGCFTWVISATFNLNLAPVNTFPLSVYWYPRPGKFEIYSSGCANFIVFCSGKKRDFFPSNSNTKTSPEVLVC